MKKTFFTLTLTVASVIALHGAILKENDGNFEQVNKDGSPARWRFNAAPAMAKKLKWTLTKDAKTGVKTFTVDTKATPRNDIPLMGRSVRCKAGDKIIISCDVKTSGSFSIGLYRYGHKMLLKGEKAKSFRIMNRTTRVKAEFIMKDDGPNKKLLQVTPVLNLPKSKVTSVSKITVELIKAEELKAKK